MFTLKTFFDLTDYRMTEGSDYNCPQSQNAYSFSYWNGLHEDGGFSLECVFDRVSQTVFIMEVCDYTRQKAYRWKNPNYEFDESDKQAWDLVDWTDVVEEDFMEKATAIVNGEDYDSRIIVPIDLSHEDLVTLCLAAHKQDITLNQFIVNSVMDYINYYHPKDQDE